MRVNPPKMLIEPSQSRLNMIFCICLSQTSAIRNALGKKTITVGQDSKPPQMTSKKGWPGMACQPCWISPTFLQTDLEGWWCAIVSDWELIGIEHVRRPPGQGNLHCTSLHSHEISWCLLGSRCTICTIAAQSFEILYIKIWPAKCDKFSPAKERPGFLRGDGLN